MSSAICFNLDESKIWSSGNRLNDTTIVKSIVSIERGKNPVPLTININLLKEIGQARDRTSNLLFPSPVRCQLCYYGQGMCGKGTFRCQVPFYCYEYNQAFCDDV